MPSTASASSGRSQTLGRNASGSRAWAASTSSGHRPSRLGSDTRRSPSRRNTGNRWGATRMGTLQPLAAKTSACSWSPAVTAGS